MRHQYSAILAMLVMSTAASGASVAPANKHIVEVAPNRIDSSPMQVVDDEPEMRVAEGKGGRAANIDVFRSDDQRFTVNVSKYEKLTLNLKDWPVDEFMYMIEGHVNITDTQGVSRTYGPGESFVMPKGFTGTWKQAGPIKKIAIIYRAER